MRTRQGHLTADPDRLQRLLGNLILAAGSGLDKNGQSGKKLQAARSDLRCSKFSARLTAKG